MGASKNIPNGMSRGAGTAGTTSSNHNDSRGHRRRGSDPPAQGTDANVPNSISFGKSNKAAGNSSKSLRARKRYLEQQHSSYRQQRNDDDVTTHTDDCSSLSDEVGRLRSHKHDPSQAHHTSWSPPKPELELNPYREVHQLQKNRRDPKPKLGLSDRGIEIRDSAAPKKSWQHSDPKNSRRIRGDEKHLDEMGFSSGNDWVPSNFYKKTTQKSALHQLLAGENSAAKGRGSRETGSSYRKKFHQHQNDDTYVSPYPPSQKQIRAAEKKRNEQTEAQRKQQRLYVPILPESINHQTRKQKSRKKPTGIAEHNHASEGVEKAYGYSDNSSNKNSLDNHIGNASSGSATLTVDREIAKPVSALTIPNAISTPVAEKNIADENDAFLEEFIEDMDDDGDGDYEDIEIDDIDLEELGIEGIDEEYTVYDESFFKEEEPPKEPLDTEDDEIITENEEYTVEEFCEVEQNPSMSTARSNVPSNIHRALNDNAALDQVDTNQNSDAECEKRTIPYTISSRTQKKKQLEPVSVASSSRYRPSIQEADGDDLSSQTSISYEVVHEEHREGEDEDEENGFDRGIDGNSGESSNSKSNNEQSTLTTQKSSLFFKVTTNDCLDIRCFDKEKRFRPSCGVYTVVCLILVLVAVWTWLVLRLLREKDGE